MVREIELIAKTHTKNSFGVPIATETATELFADISSISQSEFMSAGQIGLKPAYKFKVWEYEYNGQKVLIYNGIKYTIYRTYLASDGRVELYTEERIGENDS